MVSAELIVYKMAYFWAVAHHELHNVWVEASFQGVDFPDEVCPVLLVFALYNLQNLMFRQ
jgi:hypothetical protein